VRGALRPFAALLCALSLTTGCSALRPGEFDDFDDWWTGRPESDYELIELEGRSPNLWLLHSYALWPLFAARDALRIGAAPLVWPYFAVRGPRGEADQPAP
jgi:hypothetical protein